jgi:hypothetical protein
MKPSRLRGESRSGLFIGCLLLALVSSSCVYYNGMYNTRHYTKEAEKAEREGRRIDASSAWGQVVVRAETLLARHPASKYTPEAQVLLGRAYSNLNDCPKALAALAAGLPAVSDSTLRAKGLIAFAGCEARAGRHASAADAWTEARSLGAKLPDSTRAALAASLRESGKPSAAVEELRALDSGFVNDRLLALAADGQTDRLNALLDSLDAAGDSTVLWDPLFAALASKDPAAATTLVDRATRARGVRPADAAGWLLQDAQRLEVRDHAGALRRYQQAEALDSKSEVGSSARAARARLLAREAASVPDLGQVTALLSADTGTSLSFAAQQLAMQVGIVLAADSALDARAPQSDMRGFLAAEVARDELHAPSLAVRLFQRVAETWPESPYAAKAVLAGLLLSPGDSVARARLDSMYQLDPYVVALRGGDPPGLRALEDSLAEFSAQLRATRDSIVPARRTEPGRRVTPPGVRQRPDEPL